MALFVCSAMMACHISLLFLRFVPNKLTVSKKPPLELEDFSLVHPTAQNKWKRYSLNFEGFFALNKLVIDCFLSVILILLYVILCSLYVSG